MIEGPLTGATDSDAASSADVTALAATVASNTTAITTKAAVADLTVVEGTTATHTGQIASLNNSYNNLGNSFYTKILTDSLLSGKQATLGDGDLSIARTASLQATLDAKATVSDLTLVQGTISTHTGEIATLTSSKQNNVSNNGGGGIGLLNGVALRQVTAVAPLSAQIYYDFSTPSDPDNNNVQLSVDLSGKQDTIQCVATNALTTFTTPVTCNFDLQCADLTANSIYGGAAAQIQTIVDTAITNAYPFWIAGRVWYNGAVLRSQGRSSFTVSHTVGGVYDITFTTPHPSGGNYVITLAHENNQNWDAQTGGIEYGSQGGNGFRVILQHAPSVERSGFFFITAHA